VAKPSTTPVLSKDTSAVGGSTDVTRRTVRLPFVSAIISPIMKWTSTFTGA
jgi:hypothetical protein